MSQVEIKGTALSSIERYVREHFGEEVWRSVVAELPTEGRQLLEKGILVSAWYPFSLFLALVRALGARYGRERPRLHHEMGRAAAEYGLTTLYKIFFRVGSPQFIVSRAAKVWRTYYTSGEMTAPVSEKGHAVVELVGFAEPARELCERLPGFFERTIELSGGKDVKLVHTVCANRGGDVCRFEGRWT